MRADETSRVQAISTDHSHPLIDNYGRPITYARVSITDFCNLRCVYCMAEEGIIRVPHSEILSLEEIARLVGILAKSGITKVRVTGGEPFIRRGVMELLQHIKHTPGINTLHITTNGVITARYLDDLAGIGISGINLSLDTLNRERFIQITRCNDFDPVMQTLHALKASDIRLKINTVVLDGLNTDDILPLSRLSKDAPIDVRFIEQMPFNGQATSPRDTRWDAARILRVLRSAYPEIRLMPSSSGSTAQMYTIPGHQGRVGIIAGFSRTFCHTCNRLRITAQGMLKTCLYDHGVCDLKTLLRSGASNKAIQYAIRKAVSQRTRDGKETHQHYRHSQPFVESMALIGG